MNSEVLLNMSCFFKVIILVIFCAVVKASDPELQTLDLQRNKLEAIPEGKLVLFFSFFYTGVAIFSATMWILFEKTLDSNAPKWQNTDSLIKSPSLEYRPYGHPYDSSLIRYNASNKESIQFWTRQLDDFLSPYYENEENNFVQSCKYGEFPKPGKVCDFKIDGYFQPCTKEYNYGFGVKSGPCIFLQLNKVFGWTPECYDSLTIPDDVPDHLKQYIHYLDTSRKPPMIWVDCAGKNAADRESIGPLRYHPHRGFEQKFFPYTNIKGHLSPIVAIFFEQPQRGVLINVECKAWAHNIVRTENRGIVQFTLLIE